MNSNKKSRIISSSNQHINNKPSNNKNQINQKYGNIPKDDIYNLLVLQINNLLEELLKIFPSDILLKVAKRNMSDLYKNKKLV